MDPVELVKELQTLRNAELALTTARAYHKRLRPSLAAIRELRKDQPALGLLEAAAILVKAYRLKGRQANLMMLAAYETARATPPVPSQSGS